MSAKRICVEKDHQTSSDGENNKKKVVINSLDYNSLAKIIMLLPISERIEMEKVCAKWKEACKLAWYNIKKYKCESSIGRSYDNRLLTQSYLEKILLRCGNYLNELSLSDVCDSSIMPFIGDHCKNLTSLECEFDVDSLNHNAGHFVQGFTQLNKLKCIKIRVKHDNVAKTINLFEIIDSLPKKINEIHLFSKFPRNQKLTVSVTFEKFENLQKLTVHGFCSNSTLQEIAEKITLVHLNIRPYSIRNGFSLFNKLVNLEYIELSMYILEAGVVTENLPTNVLNTIFCTCKNLKHLDIQHSSSYDVAKIPLEKWINFQNLQHLGITCYITPDLANTLVTYCKNLKYLEISSRSNQLVDPTALKKLTELEELEDLILTFHIKLCEESIIAISNNCKKLKRVEIPGGIIVSSILGEPLSSPSVLDELSKLQYLEHLNLCVVRNLEDSTIIAIANNCKNLKSLVISSCISITEPALFALTNLKNLQKLNVSFLDIIRDSFIMKLKRLKELHCNGCKNLTNAGIIEVIKNNPDLEMINILDMDNITIDLVIAADQATKNRTNGIILHMYNRLIKKASESIIESQWLVVESM